MVAKMVVSEVLQEVTRKSDECLRFPLHYYGAYEVFKRLHRLQDLMNLAESYEELWEVADRIYKNRYSEIAINFRRGLDIRRIMDHVGPFVQSLALKLSDRDNYTTENLVRIQQTCTQLKHLALIEFDRSGYKGDNPFAESFSDTLESLFLSSCVLANDDTFFDCFTIRKSLTMIDCENISVTAMQRFFEKNQQIESFACNSRTLEYSKFLHLLPNLKRLGLAYDSSILEPNFLSTLQSLHCLALDCYTVNMNDVLLGIPLNVKNNLEELELNNVAIDEETFAILAEFNKLDRLIISASSKYEFLPTAKLPPKLKTLVMGGFHICELRFDLLIEQLITDIRFFGSTYTGLLAEWIEKHNKRKNHKANVKLVICRGAQKTTSTISLGKLSNAVPYKVSGIDFPALNSSCLTDIELEVDTYINNSGNPSRGSATKIFTVISVFLLFYSVVTLCLFTTR